MPNNFEYDGRHLMIDAIVRRPIVLTDTEVTVRLLDSIVNAIDMTMILPPVTVNFPHSVCEMTRILQRLEAEGLHDCSTANQIRTDLQLRKDESYGHSTFLMIAESHISVHTFPELGYVSFDCYSCKYFDVEKVLNLFSESYNTETIKHQVCFRTIPS